MKSKYNQRSKELQDKVERSIDECLQDKLQCFPVWTIWHQFLNLREAPFLGGILYLGHLNQCLSIGDGHLYFPCSQKNLCDLFHISIPQQHILISKLVKKGLLKRCLIGIPAKRYLAVDFGRLDDLMAEAEAKPYVLKPKAKPKQRWYRSYQEYLQSSHWQMMRAERHKKDDYRCVVCKGSDEVLHVHHKTYERLGNERLSDLCVLCESCHNLVHWLVKNEDGYTIANAPFELQLMDNDEFLEVKERWLRSVSP